jgi:hypothetical protein
MILSPGTLLYGTTWLPNWPLKILHFVQSVELLGSWAERDVQQITDGCGARNGYGHPLFSFNPCDNHPKEEILPYLEYYSNQSAMSAKSWNSLIRRHPFLGYGTIYSDATMEYIMPHTVTNGSTVGNGVLCWSVLIVTLCNNGRTLEAVFSVGSVTRPYHVDQWEKSVSREMSGSQARRQAVQGRDTVTPGRGVGAPNVVSCCVAMLS